MTVTIKSKLVPGGIIKIAFVCFAIFCGATFPTFSQPRCSYVIADDMYDADPPPPGSFSITFQGNVTATTVDLIWGSSSNADTFWGYFKTSPGTLFSPGTLGCTVGNGTSTAIATNCTLTGLTPNTLYYITVEGSRTCYQAIPPAPGTPNGYYSHTETMASNSNGTQILTSPGTPTPISASSPSQNQFTANWSAPSGGTGGVINYTVQLATNSSFTTGLQTVSPVSGTNTVFTSLSSNTNYYYRVLATNSNGSSPYSSTFTTVPTLPGSPTPTTATAIGQNQFTANWSVPPGSATINSYTVQVATNSSFTTGLQTISPVSGTSATLTGLNSNTNYYYRVLATNASGSSPYSSGSTAVLTLPDAPAPSAASAISQTQLTANWPVPSGNGTIISYTVQLATNNSFTTGLQTVSPVSGTNTVFTSLSSNTNYYYRVLATNGSGSSAYSGSYTTVSTLPDAPTPSTVSGVSQAQFTANWSTPLGNASLTYTAQLATDNGFTSVVQTSLPTSAVSTTFTGLNSNTNYYYRVLATNSSGSSPNSSSSTTVVTLPDAPAPSSASEIGQAQLTAHWSAPSGNGAINSYTVQISADNTFPSGSTQTVPGGSAIFSALSSNTTYYYRVLANNASGSSQYSSAYVTALTLPDAPSPTGGTGIDQGQFIANWSAPAGNGALTSYSVQLSSDNTFPSSSTQTIFAGAGTSTSIAGLTSGTVYYYRVSAANASGSSPYSSGPPAAVLTSPATPTGVSPVLPFVARQAAISWPGIATATSYNVQYKKSTETEWRDACTATTPGCTVSDLLFATTYDFQVRAFNGTSSPYSAPLSIVTIPDVPTNLTTTTTTTTTAHLNWAAVTGANSYLLEVATDDSFASSSLISPFLPKSISYIGQDITGLTPGTAYYWRLSAANSSGASIYSDIKPFSTNPDGGGPSNLDIVLGTPSLPTESDAQISVTSTGYFYPLTATLYYRKIMDANWSQTSNQLSGAQASPVKWPVNSSMFDEMGLEFYIKVQDHSDKSKETPHYRIYQKSDFVINPTFGTSVKDYQMISNPYDDLTGSIESLLEPILGSYDPKQWRFVQYQNGSNNGDNVDYKQQGLSKSPFTRGKAYWLLTRKQVSLNFGSHTAPNNYQEKPFSLHLDPGWTQVGNPYPVAIDWSAVLNFNNNPRSVGKLKVFSPATGGFIESNRLEKFGGGFVHSEKDTSITIPLTSKTTSGGRTSRKSEDAFTEQGAWFVPITLEQNGVKNSFGALGMHPRAKIGKDEFDDLTLPRFLNYLEWNSHHPEYVTHKFTRDIVPTQNSFIWSFSMNSAETGPTNISWDLHQLRDCKCELIMHDIVGNVLINMGEINSYFFNGMDRSFKIYYNSEKGSIPNQIQLGAPYPNPVINQAVTIPFGFFDNEHPSMVTLQILDSKGVIVIELSQNNSARGIREITWDGLNSDGRRVQPGLYFFRVEASSDSQQSIFSGKILLY